MLACCSDSIMWCVCQFNATVYLFLHLHLLDCTFCFYCLPSVFVCFTACSLTFMLAHRHAHAHRHTRKHTRTHTHMHAHIYQEIIKMCPDNGIPLRWVRRKACPITTIRTLKWSSNKCAVD